jgi:Icc-related predicted phosphoesterase
VPAAAAVVAEAVEEQYARLFAVLPDHTYAIPGNVDVPRLWPAHPGVRVPDGEVVEIGGLRCGFVGGVPLPPGREPRAGGPWTPHLLPAAEYRAAVEALPELDVLFSHAPPEVPALYYDVVTRRRELPGLGLRARIDRDRPRAALFGHVHQPLAARLRVGRTECVNAGYFRRTGVPYVLRW